MVCAILSFMPKVKPIKSKVEPQFNVTDLPEHVSKRFKYFDQGLVYGCYTIQATAKDNEKEYYYSFVMYPTGPGARSRVRPEDSKNTFMYQKTSLARHRSQKAARARAVALTLGEPISDIRKPKRPKQETGPNEGYCMKERKVRPMYSMEAGEMKNGRSMIKGKCEFCDTAIIKIGKLVDCPMCERTGEAGPSDYICKECRS